GQRAYARVRAGERPVLAARRVTISRLELVAVRRPTADLLDCDVEVTCSTGTYVRAIARDLGAGLGVGGHLTALRRTRVGGFPAPACRGRAGRAELSARARVALAQGGPPASPRRDVAAEPARVLAHGGRLPPVGLPGVYGVFGPDGTVVALVEERDGAAR